MTRFPASVPRAMFWSTDVGGCSHCPQCGGPLTSDCHSYLVAVRQGAEIETFISGNSDGYFCQACPVVVLDRDAFVEPLAFGFGSRSPSSLEIATLGIVDLDAVPEDKGDVPLGEDDNPVPLVRFTNVKDDSGQERRAARPRLKRKANRQRKKKKGKRKNR